MNFKVFIGIDVSKSDFHVFIHHKKVYAKFSNNQDGFEKMITWVTDQVGNNKQHIAFAFEHTGLYSLNLSAFLDGNDYQFTILPGLELKRSQGMRRGKSDKTDARAICEYVYEKKEKLKLYQMPSKLLLQLKRLLSYRERLVKERAAFKSRLKEYKAFLVEHEDQVLFQSHKQIIACLDQHIKIVETELYHLIKQDQKLLHQFHLINSIKCVGPQTALTIIVLTSGFNQFDTWRKFASYAGVAPFPNESGTFKGRAKISHLANKRMKTLLSNCAVSAIQHNPEMKRYYQRRVAEGKNEMSTKNIIRNKLLARIFAVIERQTPYVDTLKYVA